MSKRGTIGALVALVAVSAAALYAEAGTKYEFTLKGAKNIPMNELRSVTRSLAKAAEPLGWEGPMPEIRFIEGFDTRLPTHAAGRAIRYSSGREVILLRRSQRGVSAARVARHELAHLQTWREYGIRVDMHGKEFKEVCRRIAFHADCEAEG